MADDIHKLTRSEIASMGGQSTSEAKQAAARENGKLGGGVIGNKGGPGRPRKYATASERQRAYIERKKLRVSGGGDTHGGENNG